MPHVHNVSSDEDELDEDHWGYEDERGERRPIPWIPIASAGAAVVLVLVLVVLLFRGGGSSAPTPTTTAATAAPLPPLAATDPRVVAAQAALDAWGTFEGTGALSDLGTTMDPSGPQYRALQREAEAKSTTGAYTAVITNPRLVEPTAEQVAVGEQIVRGDVVWQRAGQPDRTVTWDLALRSRISPPGLWLWTARAVTDGTAATGSGSATGPADFCAAAKTAAGVPTQADLNARLSSAKTDPERLTISKDVIGQRTAADAQLAASAPPEIKAQAEATAAGWAVYKRQVDQVQQLKDIPGAYESASKDPTFTAGEKARPEVIAYVQRVCAVNIDPQR